MRDRFDIDLLDSVDPFEVDDENRPHLYKHLPYVSGRHVAVGIEEILDVYLLGDPMYEPGREDGKADWVMIERPRELSSKYPWHRRTNPILQSVGLSVCIAQTLESGSATENG